MCGARRIRTFNLPFFQYAYLLTDSNRDTGCLHVFTISPLLHNCRGDGSRTHMQPATVSTTYKIEPIHPNINLLGYPDSNWGHNFVRVVGSTTTRHNPI